MPSYMVFKVPLSTSVKAMILAGDGIRGSQSSWQSEKYVGYVV